MKNPTELTGLEFFDVGRYYHTENFIFDVSDCPRPHFCMGLVLNGRAIFHDCVENTDVEVGEGEIIFVPISSRYVASWTGAGEICYISMHFNFGYPTLFSERQNFLLQKVEIEDFTAMAAQFRLALLQHNGGEGEQLSALAIFYTVLSEVVPKLKKRLRRPIDPRLDAALSYIVQNYKNPIRVEQLAAACNMSVSRFFPRFREELGMTPVDYINRYRINRAMLLLGQDGAPSVEAVSETVGFESSAYFRRVFRKITGRSPKEYRSTKTEI